MASQLDDSILFNALQSRKQHFMTEHRHLSSEECERQWGEFISTAALAPKAKLNSPLEAQQSKNATSGPKSIPAKRAHSVRSQASLRYRFTNSKAGRWFQHGQSTGPRDILSYRGYGSKTIESKPGWTITCHLYRQWIS